MRAEVTIRDDCTRPINTDYAMLYQYLYNVFHLITHNRPPPCSNGPAFLCMCHTLRFCAMSFIMLYSFMSSLMLSSHLFLGLPLLLFPSTCMFNIFLVVSSPFFSFQALACLTSWWYPPVSSLKLQFRQYPVIHANYSISNCTISN